MGFFGGSKTKIPASGYYSQPKAYQDLYTNVLGQAKGLTANANVDAFTPLGVTADEQAAFDMLRQGFAPTAESLASDISMFTNPYDEYVINGINREATGQNSLVNQAATQAGQQGSNRSFLATSDVEQNRLNNIGQFRQNNYNTAVQNVLGPLANLRQGDANNLLGIGGFERGLDAQTKQAPYAAMTANLGVLNGIPTQFGNFGTPAQTVKTGGGLGGIMSGIGNIGGLLQGAGGVAGALGYGGTASSLGSIGSALGFFSDEKLKENIKPMGQENGHNIYEFTYKDDPSKTKYIGVMAQEVQKTNPDAVSEVSGYLAVDYSKIGVKMRTV